MAESQSAVTGSEAAPRIDFMATPISKNEPPKKRGPSIHQIYALPAPLQTFPLPAFFPNNPLSWLHLFTAWVRQALSPPPLQPALRHRGVWDQRTRSVHVRDWSSMRALWEQGFYGKGSFSRSEPNWLKREQVLRGESQAHVSELMTAQRREERARFKWERGRVEQQAIMKTRRQEAGFVGGQFDPFLIWQVPPHTSVAPVGPLEILSLPNSDADISSSAEKSRQRSPAFDPVDPDRLIRTQCDDPRLASFPFPLDAGVWRDPTAFLDKGPPLGQMPALTDLPVISFNDLSRHPQEAAVTPGQNERKTVPHSSVVNSATFQFSGPSDTVPFLGLNDSEPADVSRVMPGTDGDDGVLLPTAKEAELQPLVNIEYLQLMSEEAFFLAFALGALEVFDAASGRMLSTTELFVLARQNSYFPPRNGPDDPELEPDDRFLLHYAVYHHFRSLGWVPRGGIKFGVDWLLYTKGPVFDHAEFGLIILPSYSDARWKIHGKRSRPKTWAWLHSIVRVLSHAVKSLVLVYVDVPPPESFEEALAEGISTVLGLYRIREVMVKRWSSNRNR